MKILNVVVAVFGLLVMQVQSEQVLYASSDAVIRRSAPDLNFGAEQEIQIRSNNGDTNLVYLKIDASGLDDQIIQDIASIEAYALPVSSPRSAKVMMLTDPSMDWEENRITWNNAPISDKDGKLQLAGAYIQLGTLNKSEGGKAGTVSLDWEKGGAGAKELLVRMLNTGSRQASLIMCASSGNQKYASRENPDNKGHAFRISVRTGPGESSPVVGERMPADSVLIQSPVLTLLPDAGRQEPDLNPPTLRWPVTLGSGPYKVFIGRQSDLADAQMLQVPTKDTLMRPFKSFDPGVWFWKVVAADGKESSIASFDIKPDLPVWNIPSWEELLSNVPSGHPRIYMRPETLPGLRARASGEYKDMVEARKNDVLLNVVGQVIPDLPVNKGIGGKWFGKQEKAYVNGSVRRLMELAHLYSITQDERIADEIYRRTLHYLQYSVGELGSPKRNDFANSWVVASFAAAYDAIHDRWTQKERDRLAAAILERMDLGLREYMPGGEGDQQQFNSGSHAWQWVIRNMTIGALALFDEYPDAREYFEWSLKLHVALYPWYGGADGGSAECRNYYEGTGFHTAAETAALFGAATGLDFFQKPWYRNTLWHLMYIQGLGAGCSQFGDQSELTAIEPKPFYTAKIFAGKVNNPYFTAYWNELNSRYSSQYTGNDSLGWMELFLQPLKFAEPVSLAELPKARRFRDIGLVTMRSDIANPENDIYFEFRSSPYGTAGAHAHADQNSFNINAYGEPLIIDSGYKDVISSEHHKTWTRQSRAHNTILINQNGQLATSWEAYGRITDFEEGDGFVRTAGAAEQAYKDVFVKQFDRHILWLQPDTFLIVDNLKTEEPSQFQWLLHTANKIQIDSSGKKLLISTDKAEAHVRFFAPKEINITQTDQFTARPAERPDKDIDLDAMANQWHLTAETVEPSEEMRFVSVIQVCPAGKREALPHPEIRIDGKSAELKLADGRHGTIQWE